MPYLQSRAAWWWTKTWNSTGGCWPLSSGCANCWAAQDAPLQIAAGNPLYAGTTDLIDERSVFNGTLTHWPRKHPLWTLPLHLKRPASGKILLWACATSELFLPGRPKWVLDRTFGMLAASGDYVVPLILTKVPRRLVAFLNAQPAKVQEQWKKRFWVGFSAETQGDLNKRWPHMRRLAQQGWKVFVSLAPLIGPIRLPDDFLKLAKWVIVSGEEGPHARLRDMDPQWARAVRNQCAGRIPFFFKQMSHDRPTPPGLDKQEFPEW